MKLKRNTGPTGVKEGVQSKPSAGPLPSWRCGSPCVLAWLHMADYSNTNGCQVHPESMTSLRKLFSIEVDVTIYRS